MSWLPIAAFLLVAAWAALAYAVVGALLAPRLPQARLVAAASAGLVALIVVLAVVLAPRPGGPPDAAAAAAAPSATTAAVAAPVAGVHHVSCDAAAQPASGIAQGAVDGFVDRQSGAAVADDVSLDGHDELLAQGWATDAAAQHPVAAVCIFVDGKPLRGEQASYGLARPDVVQVLGQAGDRDSGFRVSASLAPLAAGPHQVALVALVGQGTYQIIGSPRRVTVR